MVMLSTLLISHLFVRACIIFANLTILFLLHRRHNHQNLVSRPYQSCQRKSFQRGSTGIVIMKLMLDVTILLLVILRICNRITAIEEGKEAYAASLIVTGNLI